MTHQPTRITYSGIVQAALITVVAIAAIAYGTIAIGARDALWFSSRFDRQPVSVTVYCGGQAQHLGPGDAAYTDFVNELNRLISGRKRWDTLSLSNVTEAEYKTRREWVAVELAYSPPIRIHSEYPYFSNTDTLVVPLVGRHADTAPLFGKAGGQHEAGSFHLMSNETLLEILAGQGICRVPDGG